MAFPLVARRVSPDDTANLRRNKAAAGLQDFILSLVTEGDEAVEADERVDGHTGRNLTDHCPLSFDEGAIEWSMPPLLREIAGAVTAFPATRFWVRTVGRLLRPAVSASAVVSGQRTPALHASERRNWRSKLRLTPDGCWNRVVSADDDAVRRSAARPQRLHPHRRG